MQDDDNSNDLNLEQINQKLEKNTISMKILEKSIKEHPSSLNMVDMSIYENWIKKIS
jgi:hypothetical protein